ncbi:MAG TPA: patatin-like phospholipase family protein [Acidimicrobiia bacterium]|nr:patatin-like phospholipase family protein [Acidimicrobiia bacterium]
MTERTVDRLVRTARANLRRRFARQPVAVAVSGGGSQGSFETGALRYLYDELNVRPSILCGSSVGAIIAAKLAEGDDPETGRRAIDDLEAIWRGLRGNEDMWLPEPWLDKLRVHTAWATSMRDRAGEHGTTGSQTRVVLRMLGEIVRNPPEADGTLDALRQALRAKSLLRMDPVREILAERINPALIEQSGIALRIGAVSLESGALRYITETGAMCARDGTPLDVDPVPLRDAVLASASIPVIFPPTELAGEHYVDGGAREILPLELAITNLGARHIFAVVASTPGVDEIQDIGDRGLLDIARRVASDIGPDETLRKEMHPPRGWGRRVTFIAPELDVHDALTIDPVLISASLDYGYMRAADVLLGLDPKAARLSREIARARMRIREAEGPVVGFDADPPDEPSEEVVAAEIIDVQTARLTELVAARRAAGAPLPPGECERVRLASFGESEVETASVSDPRAADARDGPLSPRPDPS